MDKQRFRIDKNEKLIARLQRLPKTVINNYSSEDTEAPIDNTIMGKPVVKDTVPRDGEVLIYNATIKEWEAGVVDSMRGNAVFASATEPTDMEVGDIWIQI